MRFIFLYWLIKAIGKSVFEDTVNFSERKDFLIIKPRYAPIILPIILRGFFALCAGGFLLITLVGMTNGAIKDAPIIPISICIVVIIALWVMFRKTRKSLMDVVIPTTIFGKAHQVLTIGKHIRIPFGEIIGIRLTNEQISGNMIMVSIRIMTQDTEHRICNMVYKKQELSQNLHRFMKLILTSLISSSSNLSDYLIQVDWDDLTVKRGYSEDIILKRKIMPVEDMSI